MFSINNSVDAIILPRVSQSNILENTELKFKLAIFFNHVTYQRMSEWNLVGVYHFQNLFDQTMCFSSKDPLPQISIISPRSLGELLPMRRTGSGSRILEPDMNLKEGPSERIPKAVRPLACSQDSQTQVPVHPRYDSGHPPPLSDQLPTAMWGF